MNPQKTVKWRFNPLFEVQSRDDLFAVMASLKEFYEASDDNPFAKSAEDRCAKNLNILPTTRKVLSECEPFEVEEQLPSTVTPSLSEQSEPYAEDITGASLSIETLEEGETDKRLNIITSGEKDTNIGGHLNNETKTR